MSGALSSASPNRVRILLVADTHLGFDLPFRPRVERRRRGHDFFANFERALEPALRGEVDLVVHGGDLFYRSKAPPALVELVLAPLVKVADRGTPVFLVPGNHERSRIPLHLWTSHPGLHLFSEPMTSICSPPTASIALSGFPFARRVREKFGDLLRRTGHYEASADVHLLCMHQTVEGAQVGPSDFTFRAGPDVVPGSQIPGSFAAALCGHIHRSQVLTHDLRGRPLAAPVVYPGAVERTSFAERLEPKHYVRMDIVPLGQGQARVADLVFVPLPARPMVALEVQLDGHTPESLSRRLREQLSALDPDAIVKVRLRGDVSGDARSFVTAGRLRGLAPPTMNVSLVLDRRRAGRYSGRARDAGGRPDRRTDRAGTE